MYWTCPYCGSNLDAGERCDCLQKGELFEANDGGSARSAAKVQQGLLREAPRRTPCVS